MNDEGDSGGASSSERALFYRKLGEYVSVSTILSPLFRFMRWYASLTPDEIYLLTVDPFEIDQIKFFPTAPVPVTGRDALCGAVGGPWDRLTLSVESHYVSQSIRAHLEAGVPWSDTQLFRHPSYEHDRDKALRRGEKIDRLVESIKTNGYQQQFDPDADDLPSRNENAQPNERIGDVYVADEPIVGLDRDGEFVHLRNGRHRLAVARHLGVEEVPVVLSLVHPKAKEQIPADARLIQPD